jgi:biopolymer transport protein ExbB/TolQ
MFQGFGEGGLGFAIQHLTLEGRITIGVLIVTSLVSWAVMVGKVRQLRKSRKLNAKFLQAFRDTDDPMDLYRAQTGFEGSPLYGVYLEACEEMESQLGREAKRRKPGVAKPNGNGKAGRIPPLAMNTVRVAAERGLGEEVLALEGGMIVLATAISGGPFIGLLGTVWGVMETFTGVAKAQAANLTAMAPGVSAALIATVTGLMVAIPALFGYNYLVTKIRGFTLEMDNFASELNSLFEYAYLRGGSSDEHDEAEADHAMHEEHRASYAMSAAKHNVG